MSCARSLSFYFLLLVLKFNPSLGNPGAAVTDASKIFSENATFIIYPSKIGDYSLYKDKAPNFANPSTFTILSKNNITQWAPDLISIYTDPNTRNVSICIKSGKSGFKEDLVSLTKLPIVNESKNNVFLFKNWDQDQFGDLIYIETNLVNSSTMKMHVFSGRANFQEKIGETVLPLEPGGNYSFSTNRASDATPVLYAIKNSGNTDKNVEWNTLTFKGKNRSEFKGIWKTKTTIPETDTKWKIGLLNYTQDLHEEIVFYNEDQKRILVFENENISPKLYEGSIQSYQNTPFKSEAEFKLWQDDCISSIIRTSLLFFAVNAPIVTTTVVELGIVQGVWDLLPKLRSCAKGLSQILASSQNAFSHRIKDGAGPGNRDTGDGFNGGPNQSGSNTGGNNNSSSGGNQGSQGGGNQGGQSGGNQGGQSGGNQGGQSGGNQGGQSGGNQGGQAGGSNGDRGGGNKGHGGVRAIP